MCQVEPAVILVTLSRKQSVFKVDFKFLEQCHIKGQLDRADFDLRETMILDVSVDYFNVVGLLQL